jgi:hypothetical protein
LILGEVDVSDYRVKEIYSDAALRAAADGDEGQFFKAAVARILLRIPADWRQSVLADALRATMTGPTLAEIEATVNGFLQGRRPPRMESPLVSDETA